jgi:hypothetical protein
MGSRNTLVQRADRAAVATIRNELSELEDMTVGELAEKYLEVFGTRTRTRNKEYLRKHIAWRIQERVEGGMSPRAIERIEQLAPQAPGRWRRPVIKHGEDSSLPAASTELRDPRLPAVGTTFTRLHNGVEHTVTVRAGGFDYNGERHRSLSKIARLITGKAWNGFVFFFGRALGDPSSAQGGAA